MNKPYKRNITEPVPSNADVLVKGGRTIARWTDDKGKVRQAKVVTSKAGGHRIVVAQDEKYTIAYWTANGRKTRVAHRDYDSSVALLQRLEREASQRAEGIITGFDDHRRTAVSTHLDDYMVNGPRKTATSQYLGQHRARIERIIKGIGATRLHDLDPIKIDRFFAAEEISGHTRNEYIGSIRAFTKWAAKHQRVERDPLQNLDKTPRNLIQPEHPRRAITIEEFNSLLDATERRPLIELLTVRTGKNKGTQTANVSDRAKAKANRVGAERRLAYQLGMWACLRRNEIEQLRWGDIVLDAAKPVIRLRAHTTKGRRADAVEVFPPLLAALQAAKGTKTLSEPVVLHVPSMKVIKADLAMARIAYEDDNGFTDFHALRMCCNTWMAVQRASLSARQKHLRHTDPRLTAITYIDQQHISAATELFPPQPVPASSSGTAHMQRTTGLERHGVTFAGNDPVPKRSCREGNVSDEQGDKDQTLRHDMANEDAGLQSPASFGRKEAGEGGRTLDIHVGNVTLYH